MREAQPVIVRQGVTTPNGHSAVFLCRDDTNDANLVIGINEADEYRMRGRDLSGTAIDVGAHIGAVAVAMALDHPDLKILAVEAVPENVALLVENVERNGVADRVTVIPKFAAKPGTAQGTCHYGYRLGTDDASPDYIVCHRFVGGTWGHLGGPEFSPTVEAVSLDDLIADPVSFLKIDCEGCEWTFLDTGAVAQVQTIVGEYHGGLTESLDHVDAPRDRIVELLTKTHDVSFWMDEPVVGLFEATRR